MQHRDYTILIKILNEINIGIELMGNYTMKDDFVVLKKQIEQITKSEK